MTYTDATCSQHQEPNMAFTEAQLAAELTAPERRY